MRRGRPVKKLEKTEVPVISEYFWLFLMFIALQPMLDQEKAAELARLMSEGT
jgi:hypothetical protein